ncbi:response regulator transcription factor [Curtobacterium pusillum]|uniref:response regulator transcription factor n=1 Tax=Curtobacterium pusillum TaxID=69373 RepID=UPI0011A2AE36|nr:helix-turn-helix transcriptional regulator [Curtobacterium pusillum]
MAVEIRPELARLAAAAGPADQRAQEMLRVLHQLVPFDGAWVSVLVGSEYLSLASSGIGADVERYLSGPVMARDIELTGTDRHAPPLSPSDLPYPADDLRTWAECLYPSGLHEALATALFEPGGRHVGFIAVLSADRRPPTAARRRDLARATELLARIVDPMSSVTALIRLVDGAFAGVLLRDDGGAEPLPGLPGSDLLDKRSELLDVIRAQPPLAGSPTSFLWPSDGPDAPHDHVRVTHFALSGATAPGVRGIVLLSPPADLRGLTRRELEVLGHMLDGSSNDQIARDLVVTSRTVATHVEHIMVKLSSPSRTHAAVRAQREGLYVPPVPTPLC